MVLTKDELIASLHNEVRILLHLATKVDPSKLDYRPTPKQRSTIELLRYMSIMGPGLAQAAVDGGFDPVKWTAAVEEAGKGGFDHTVAVIAAQPDRFDAILGPLADDDFRTHIEMFGRRATLGQFFVNTVLAGYAAYRTQLFNYLKAGGREELSTMNLWAGMDAAPPA